MHVKTTARVLAAVLAAGATLAGTAQAKPSNPGGHPFYSSHGIVQPQKHKQAKPKAKQTQLPTIAPTAPPTPGAVSQNCAYAHDVDCFQ